MTDIQALLDQIEDMNDASEDIRWRHNKEKKELISELLQDLHEIIDIGPWWRPVLEKAQEKIEKWEKRLKV